MTRQRLKSCIADDLWLFILLELVENCKIMDKLLRTGHLKLPVRIDSRLCADRAGGVVGPVAWAFDIKRVSKAT